MKNIICFLSIPALVIVLIFVPFRLLVFNEPFYNYELNKLGVYEELGKEKTQQLINQALYFLDTGNGNLPDFNEREVSHLHDVKQLVDIFLITGSLSIFLLILFCYFQYNEKYFSYSFVYSGISCLALILTLCLMVLINFNYFFTGFHNLFFKPGTWMFDPSIEIIKQLFPDAFFMDFVLFWVLGAGILSIISILFGIIYNKAFKPQKNKKKK
jgi:integral membrane protein (TIGR01906 family)